MIFRVIMGLAMSFIGAMMLDSLIFREDIHNRINAYKEVQVSDARAQKLQEFENNKTDLIEAKNQTYQDWMKAKEDYRIEIQGKEGGSGIPGNGRIAAQLEKIMLDAKLKYEQSILNLEDLNFNIDSVLKCKQLYHDRQEITVYVKV